MNPPRPTPPRDEDIDALLARRYRDTTPEFEARWVELKRDLRQRPMRRHPLTWLSWNRWVLLGGVAAVMVALTVATRWRETPSTVALDTPSPALVELFAMDAVLGHATALLDAENREALLFLPAQSQSPL
jgi:hypothetical protein